MLLHRGSIVLEVCLILIVTKCGTSQEYDYSAEDGDYNSENTEDGYSHPDYTKYFSGKSVVNPESAQNLGYNGGLPNEAEFDSFFYSLGFDPNSKASTAPQTFVPNPPKKADPFEALRKSFGEKESASETNPLNKDYFEESQKKEQNAEQEDEGTVHPGPHYVSHQIPVPVFENEDEDEAQSKDDVETIPPPLKGKHNPKRVKIDPARPGFDGFKDSYDAFDILRKTEEQIDQTNVEPTRVNSAKKVDYNTGKSSAISQAYPAASGYLAALKIPTTTLSPYQKYSFQPDTSNYEALQSKYLGTYASTPNPTKHAEKDALNDKDDGFVAPSNNVPESLQNKGCRKIVGPENADGMNCFVCEDAANKAKYTQCSYSSSDEPVNEYAGSSLRYSLPVKAPASFRQKRSPGRGSYGDDPYFRVAESSKKYFDDFEKEQKAEESKREKDFYYSPEDYESYSETHSSELLKEPGACHTVEREGMSCTVCKNPKTGGNFEQCSYASAPKEQKYAYVAEKKYDSDDDAPEETKTIIKQSSAEPQKKGEKGEKGESSSLVPSTIAPISEFTTATKSKIVRDVFPELTAAGTTIDETSEESPEADEESDEEADEEADDEKESEESDEKKEEKKSSDDEPSYLFNYDELKKDKKLVDDDPYYVPEHFAETVTDKKTADAEAEDDGFDEYHYKLFPVFQNEAESKKEEQKQDPEGNQQDVEEVLAEFAKKDRSNCKKAEKNGMTCFLCVDKNKVQHEECMYIAESRPKATHVAFHEVQRLKDAKDEEPTEESDGEESKVESLTQQPLDTVLPLASETSKRKKFFKKVITTPLPLANFELSAAASDVYRTVVPFDAPKKRYSRKVRKDSKASSSAPDSERLEEDEGEQGEQTEQSKKKNSNSDEQESPPEINVGDEEGAYSHETKPVYSKKFGTTLPKYMVEKTEFEKEFDDAAGFD